MKACSKSKRFELLDKIFLLGLDLRRTLHGEILILLFRLAFSSNSQDHVLTKPIHWIVAPVVPVCSPGQVHPVPRLRLLEISTTVVPVEAWFVTHAVKKGYQFLR